MSDNLKRQKDALSADPTTDILTESASEYVSGLLRQEGLYVGLGLGAVAGGLLLTRDIGTALRRASDLIGLAQRLAMTLQAQEDASAGELGK